MLSLKAMNETSKILDDVAQLAGSAVGIAAGVKEHVHNDIKARVEEVATRLDLVPREDFERLETTLHAAIEKINTLEERIKGLEQK